MCVCLGAFDDTAAQAEGGSDFSACDHEAIQGERLAADPLKV